MPKSGRQPQDLAGRQQARKRARALKRVGKQRQTANIKAKYGATGRPAPVVVKKLDGEVVRVVDQSRLLREAYAGQA